MTFAEFVKDWLPGLAILGGASWVFFNWLLGEHRRRKKEMPAVDGDLTWRNTELGGRRVVVSLSAKWGNPSPLPIYIDLEATRIDVYFLGPALPDGPLNPRTDLGDPQYRYHLLESMGQYVLEPHTNSVINAHFILARGGLFFFRFKLYRNRARYGGDQWAWTREAVVKT